MPTGSRAARKLPSSPAIAIANMPFISARPRGPSRSMRWSATSLSEDVRKVASLHVDDREPAVAEPRLPDGHAAVVVGPAMGQAVEHARAAVDVDPAVLR